MDHQKFAQCVKDARTENGLTQKELASRLHVSDKAVSKWERGLSFPDIELLGPLSRELTIPLSALLDVEELTVTAKEAGGQEFESLLADLLAVMKENVQNEFHRRRRVLRIRDDAAAHYDVLERHWYDKDDPTIACIQFFCYEKEHLLFPSTESYAEYRTQNGNQDSGLRKIYVETGAQRFSQTTTLHLPP